MRELGNVTNRPWLMDESHLFNLFMSVRNFRAGPGAGHAQAQTPRGIATFGSVAVIPMVGSIFHRGSMFSEWFGLRSLQWLKQSMRAAVGDPDISAIVIDWDSPGGEVDGTPETAAELFKLRGTKPIISVANTMMSSAAYWLAAQSDEVFVSPSSLSGSVGVFVLHMDHSKMLADMGIDPTFIFAGETKVDANPFEPLSERAQKDLKDEVELIQSQFLASTAKARGISPSKARKMFGDAKVHMAESAVAVGLADGVQSLDQVLQRLTKPARPARRRADSSNSSVGERLASGDSVIAVLRDQLEAVAEVVHVAGAPVGEYQSCSRCGVFLHTMDGTQGELPFYSEGQVVVDADGLCSLSSLTLEPTCQETGVVAVFVPEPTEAERAMLVQRDLDILAIAEALSI